MCCRNSKIFHLEKKTSLLTNIGGGGEGKPHLGLSKLNGKNGKTTGTVKQRTKPWRAPWVGKRVKLNTHTHSGACGPKVGIKTKTQKKSKQTQTSLEVEKAHVNAIALRGSNKKFHQHLRGSARKGTHASTKKGSIS